MVELLPSKQMTTGSIPCIRSISGVSAHLAPKICRGNGGRYVLDPKGSGAAGEPGGVATPRVRVQPKWKYVPRWRNW